MLTFDRLTPEDYARCRFEAEVEAGLWEEVEVEVEGEYSDHEVRHHPWPCDFVLISTISDSVERWIHGYRREGCVPKKQKIKRWRRVYGD